MAHYYFLIDNNTEYLTEIRTACFAEHARNTLNANELSERISFDGNQRLIKVANPSIEWIANQDWISSPAIIWYGQQGVQADDTFRLQWEAAQDPNFDGENPNNSPDSASERESWWRRLLGL